MGSVECLKCRMRSVSVECGVWSVKCRVWSEKCVEYGV